MSDHLGHEPYDRSRESNYRNGSFNKNVVTENGNINIEVPRDQGGEFEPKIARKKQYRIDGLDQKILSMYAKGMNVSQIKTQIHELYEAEISDEESVS